MFFPLYDTSESDDKSMITYVNGDLFSSPAKVLVNTVNTVGVMGKGIAHTFKRTYPAMFKTYRQYCERRQLTVGKLYLHRTSHKWILNFPTKRHWRQPSRPEYIDQGLHTFAKTYSTMGVTSIAFPALGCGNGGLDYDTDVLPLMEAHLSSLSIPIFVYLPGPMHTPPEHRDVKSTTIWLRSNPASLPFDEVWDDLLELLTTTTQYLTIPRGRVYKVEVESTLDARPALRVIAGTRTYRFDRDILLDFWQQLRDYGFVHRRIAPRYHRVSYLIPLFERLPYVTRVHVSDSPRGLRNRPAVSLQVVPPPYSVDGFLSENEYAMAEA